MTASVGSHKFLDEERLAIPVSSGSELRPLAGKNETKQTSARVEPIFQTLLVYGRVRQIAQIYKLLHH